VRPVEEIRADLAGLSDELFHAPMQVHRLLADVAPLLDTIQRVQAVCDRADRQQQPVPGVLGFFAPSTVTVVEVRAALRGEQDA